VSRKKSIFCILLFLLLLITALRIDFSALGLIKNRISRDPATPESREPAESKGENLQAPPPPGSTKLPRLTEPWNILVVGIDKASSIGGYIRPKPWRADVIIIARVDPDRHRVSLLSVPRDTRVSIPGHGTEKIAHAHAYGEMPLTITTVEKLLGIKLDHYVSIDFAAFARMVDVLGGIEIDIQKELKTKHFHYIPGRQILNGKQAYEYVTSRDEPMADLARIDRQQQLLQALLTKVRNQAGILDYAGIYLEFKKSSETSLALKDMLKLALFVRDLKPDEMQVYKLPGRPEYINGISYYIADPDSLQKLSMEVFPEKGGNKPAG
jgi:LCP family protein required for cell wall assembly